MNFDLLFEKAKVKGIEDIQVYVDYEDGLSIQIFNGEIDKYTISTTQNLTVKGIYNSKMGVVRSEEINDDIIDFIIDSVIASANTIESEDEVFIYEGDKEYKEVKGLYNPELDKLDVKVKIENIKILEKKLKAIDKRISMVQAVYQQGTGKVIIRNSKGLSLEKISNNAVVYAYVIATDGKDQRMVVEYEMSNDYSDFDLDKLAQKWVDRATSLLGAQPCESGEYEILLTNTASAELLSSHTSMFSAESIQKNVSLLKGKIGETIGSNNITLVDDPFIAKSTQSGSFDDEGVATSYKEIIKDGVLKG